jgi:hypothetical protein
MGPSKDTADRRQIGPFPTTVLKMQLLLGQTRVQPTVSLMTLLHVVLGPATLRENAHSGSRSQLR